MYILFICRHCWIKRIWYMNKECKSLLLEYQTFRIGNMILKDSKFYNTIMWYIFIVSTLISCSWNVCVCKDQTKFCRLILLFSILFKNVINGDLSSKLVRIHLPCSIGKDIKENIFIVRNQATIKRSLLTWWYNSRYHQKYFKIFNLCKKKEWKEMNMTK